MNRVFKKLGTAENKETAAGFLQIIFVLVVVGGMLAITALLNFKAAKGPALSSAAEQLVVDVLRPSPTNHKASQTISGVVEARANVTISPEVNGRVTSVHPDLLPGGTITAGDVLFSLDKTDYEIALERAAAEVASTEADLTQAVADADNFIKDWQRVYPDQPAPALVAKEPQIAAIRARLAAAKANVRQAKTNLDRTKISAKNTARIVESGIEEGQFVVAGGQFGTYYVPESLRIRTTIEPYFIDQLNITANKPVSVTVSNSSAAPFMSTVVSIGASLDPQTRLLPLILDLPVENLTPGTFVSVKIEGDKVGDVFQLPTTALATRTSVWRVSNDKLENVPVTIVDLTNDTAVVKSFDVKDGIVTSQVPTSFATRPVKIRAVRVDASQPFEDK
ncbi:efflux RND transporter periplasmic adaptor subunit [Kordiimonas aquimaris]|uniref:efflux RND transporter periplasmic adaptor subunit n=1 Tax=Kordiimonas aquimaris TaxID=707591 RepID=UPI0021D1AC12|nr:efflux RND transporter periplasmic adaptor subunit [Kordiimonas aquimaris]